MKHFYALIFSVLTLTAFAQPHGNEWIDYSQQYYKFKITTKGIYRIDQAVLQAAGINISSIDPRNLQVFARGEEQYIYVEGESDGTFDSGDYIELYADKNDGYMDVELYDDPANHASPYYSMFNDTATYYLTWNSSTSNRRMTLETDVNFNNYTNFPYFNRLSISSYNTDYHLGEPSTLTGSTDPAYTACEGWYSYSFDVGWFDVGYKGIQTPQRYTSGPNAEIKIGLVGVSNDIRRVNMQFAGVNFDTVFTGYVHTKYNFSVPTGSLGNTSTGFDFRVYDVNGQTGFGRSVVTYITLKYPRTLAMGGVNKFDNMFIPYNASESKTRLSFSGFNGGGSAWMYDLTNHRKLTMSGSGSSYQVLVPNSTTPSQETECYMTASSQIQSISEVVPAGSNNSPMFTDFDALGGQHNFIIITHKSLMSVANQYASYRNTTGYNSLVVDVDELYDQFAHGIGKSPLSIRHFADYMLDDWGQDSTRHIFLLGKAIYSHIIRNSTGLSPLCLVPTFGYPPADNQFTVNLNGSGFAPAIPVGRLAAKDATEAQEYLEKVIQYEGNAPAEWMKRALHFVGGTGAEHQTLLGYMNVYKDAIEDTLFGGQVQTIEKNSQDPIQITLVDSIRRLVNEGVSLMNFFGHAAGSSFDVSTDDPSTYSNDGKYPLLVAMSCLSGDIHAPPQVLVPLSEGWVLNDHKGAIGFVASVATVLPVYLHAYSTQFFRNFSRDNYGQTVGQIMQQTIADATQPNNKLSRWCSWQTTLHGDPAVVINSFAKPDLSIADSTVYYTPDEVTTVVDSFDVNVIITNLGRTFNDSFRVEIARTLPNGVAMPPEVKQVGPIYYRDTVTLRLPVDLINGVGLNQLHIRVDSDFIIDEESETNNSVTLDLLIKSPDIFPVYPYEFSVMPEQGITLKASTGDAFAPERTYIFELDTTDLFNSPLKQTTTIVQSGGVVTWAPNLLQNMPDSTVYFWRAGLDSVQYGAYNWRESSFQYIQGKEGWGQAHFFQFKKDEYHNIDYNRTTRTFDFVPTTKNISCHNLGYDTLWYDNYLDVEFRVNGALGDYGGCALPEAIHIAVVDPGTLNHWETCWTDPLTNIIYNQEHCGQGNTTCNSNRPHGYFIFRMNQLNSMVNFLTTHVPDSAYVLAYTWRRGNFQNWSQAQKDVFLNMGSLAVDTINDGRPWIFFAKKGDPSTAMEMVGADGNSAIDFSALMQGTTDAGTIEAPLIGPASEWHSFHWRQHPLETPTSDSVRVDIIGVRVNQTEQLILGGLTPDTVMDILNLGTLVDANQFPYLKLYAYTMDSDSARTPAQIDRWHVLFDGVPEAALNPSAAFHFVGQELAESDSIQFAVAIENISDYDMDSLLVSYWIIDANGSRHDIPYPRQDSLRVGGTLLDTVTYSTFGLGGLNSFWIEANPNNDQLERYHFNNLANISFTVEGDRINPILDVTFDGVHILDGDIVSAKPTIVMELDDENPYLIMDEPADTGLFAVYLKRPSSITQERIYFTKEGSAQMIFTPAQAPENKCKIEFPAIFSEDGVYELIVQAKDKSNNNSGDVDYHISFEVVNKSTITNIINYPNPFSTSTRFVFVLTGSEIPTDFRIQIMTISGKVVKEIGLAEIGPINIGRNITQYAWDGKDEYGDQLANGIYLYRVMTRINSQNIELRESGVDQYIKSGFGKMYLMR